MMQMMQKKRTDVLFFACSILTVLDLRGRGQIRTRVRICLGGEVAERRRAGRAPSRPPFTPSAIPSRGTTAFPDRGRHRAARERRRALPVALAASETAPSLRPSLAQSIPPSPNGVGSGGACAVQGLRPRHLPRSENAYRIEVHTKNAKSTCQGAISNRQAIADFSRDQKRMPAGSSAQFLGRSTFAGG